MSRIKELRELSQNFSVLYVEDDVSIQKSMSDYLSKFFKEVVSVENGAVGLEAYKEGDFDIVITDIAMPLMNGLDMIEKIKEIDSEQLVLVTSAHSESEYMMGAIRAGIDGYIIKPFDFEQLNNALFKIVEKLFKFQENIEYKNHLEELVSKKTDMLSSLLSFQHDNYEKTIYSMVEMIEDRDTYTAGHSKRVATYSRLIAQEMGFSEDDCLKIYQAGILHDIGKIATPDSVLLNPKILNDLEYKLIQEHVNVGYRLIKNVPMFEPLAEIIYSHHERYDGKGYPRGLKGNEVIPLAQIMIVADSFDAMTTNRIYKARKTKAEAFDELELLKEQQFHPNVVEAALVALKGVELEHGITQLPSNKLEEERFSYFYRDILTEIYNHDYLDLLLVRNSYEKVYFYLYTFFLKDFTHFNKKFGWGAGDVVLKDIAHILREHFKNSLVFRVFGDDFIVLSQEKQSLVSINKLLEKYLKKQKIEFTSKSINLEEVSIDSSRDIEKIDMATPTPAS
jgi:diguanylate cyclase (GGDEF)-like protein/putative nucleotidyltransferase with HDIG domain